MQTVHTFIYISLKFNKKTSIIEFINDFGDRAMEKEQNPSAKLFKVWDTFLDNVCEVWNAETKPKFDQL